jgi:hypothetical protein
VLLCPPCPHASAGQQRNLSQPQPLPRRTQPIRTSRSLHAQGPCSRTFSPRLSAAQSANFLTDSAAAAAPIPVPTSLLQVVACTCAHHGPVAGCSRASLTKHVVTAEAGRAGHAPAIQRHHVAGSNNDHVRATVSGNGEAAQCLPSPLSGKGMHPPSSVAGRGSGN